MSLRIANFSLIGEAGIVFPDTIKFKTAYSVVRIAANDTFRLKYLHERYAWFNTHSFGNTLEQEPLLALNNEKKILGMYKPWVKGTYISRQMFSLKTDADLLGTLAHELSHKYVSEVLNVSSSMEDAHGVSWQSTMHKIGLPANKLFTGDNRSLLSVDRVTNLEIQDTSLLRLSEKDVLTLDLLLELKKPKIGVFTDAKGKTQYVAYLPIKTNYGDQKFICFKKDNPYTYAPTVIPITNLRKTFDTKKVFAEFFTDNFLSHYRMIATVLTNNFLKAQNL
jgi:hypothetical protein